MVTLHYYCYSLQKLLIDEKPCYIFGRAKDICDFPLPHQSCSRQHAALVYHKHLNRPFLIDLGSSELGERRREGGREGGREEEREGGIAIECSKSLIK